VLVANELKWCLPDDHIRAEINELFCKCSRKLVLAISPTVNELDIAPLEPT
jgi:hypothetical protein